MKIELELLEEDLSTVYHTIEITDETLNNRLKELMDKHDFAKSLRLISFYDELFIGLKVINDQEV